MPIIRIFLAYFLLFCFNNAAAQKSIFLEGKASLSLTENSVPKESNRIKLNNRDFFNNHPTFGYAFSIGFRHENLEKSRISVSYGIQYWKVNFMTNHKAYYTTVNLNNPNFVAFQITPNSIDPVNETINNVNEKININYFGIYFRPNYQIKRFTIGFGTEISLINNYIGTLKYSVNTSTNNNDYNIEYDYKKGDNTALNGVVSNIGNQVNFTPLLSYSIKLKDKILFKPNIEFVLPIKPFLKQNINLPFLSFNNFVGNYFFSFRVGLITEFCIKK